MNLYEHYGENDECLYVGISTRDSPLDRQTEHGRRAPWASQVRKTIFTPFNSVAELRTAEREARGDNEGEARFASAQFGTGNGIKAQAMQLLLPRIKDKVLLAA